MHDDQMAACGFPTTIALIDDNASFLKTLQTELQLTDYATKGFTNPVEFVQFFNDVYQPNNFLQQCVSWLDENIYHRHTLDINIKQIHEIIYNPKRFSEIAVILVDYSMPAINGLDMISQLSHKKVKKILLTGEANDRLAINAFNQGLIHSFIRKDEKNFMEVLIQTITNLSRQYFKEISELIIAGIVKDTQSSMSLVDSDFINLFNKICQEHAIIEYYLADELGSFLLLDKNSNISWLIVTNNQKVNVFYEMAKDFNQNVEPISKKILIPLKQKTKIPFYYSENNKRVLPNRWLKHLYSLKKINPSKNYYYTLITGKAASDIDQKSIMSYQQFLTQLQD